MKQQKDKKIDVSVIIPASNYSDYMARALDCLAQEQFKGTFEVILVISPSTDDVIERSWSYREKIRNLNIITVSSPFHALNNRLIGVKAAQGKYLYFMDADDTVSPFLLQRCFDTAEKNEADIVCFNFTLLYKKKKGEGIKKVVYPFHKHRKYNTIQGLRALFQDIYIRGFFWNKFYKRELFSHKPLLRYDYMFEDCVFNVGLFYYAKKTVLIPDSLYFYNKTEEGSSTSVKRTTRTFWHLGGFFAARYFLEQKNDAKALRAMKSQMWRIWLSLQYDFRLDKENGCDEEYIMAMKTSFQVLKDFSSHLNTGRILYGELLDKALYSDENL